jgi:DNA primase
MSGKIPKTFIDDLLARTDIVDVIGGFVSLRKAGKNYHALCPFHDEKTPSFTVSHDKQFYHCFGCGANGTAIGFLMDYSRMDFIEAVEELAGRAGVEVPREKVVTAKEEGVTELYELMEIITRFYRSQLRDHPGAGRAVDYLKGRGITGELAAQFEMGYAPPGWDNLIRSYGLSDAALKRLSLAGLTITREGTSGYYDRFRDRIIFPIRDHRGRAIGFGGRTLGDEKPKYLNSPETPVFHKGRELYGLYQARQTSKQEQRVFVVEGYMDVLALVQHGVSNVVATLGTAVTPDHLNRVFRHYGQVIFCFDGDEAGRKAAWKAMETTLPLLRDGRQAFFMFMPDGMDPDDFVRKHGRGAFTEPGQFVPLSDYLINTLKSGNDLSTREGRSRLVDLALPLVATLPQSTLRQILLRDLAEIAHTPVTDIEPLLPKSGNDHKNHNIRKKPRLPGRTPVTVIIELILHRPALASHITDPMELAAFPVPGIDFLKDLVELVHARPTITCAGIVENWRGTKYGARLLEIAANSEERVTELPDPGRELADAMQSLRHKRDKQFRKKLSNIRRMSDLTQEGREQLKTPGGRRRNIPADK